MTDGLRIVVLGYLVRGPIGGMAWSDLHYLLGLRDLGHDVWFVEDSLDYPACYDPRSRLMVTDPSYGLAYAERVLSEAGFGDRWAYHDAHRSSWLGPCADRAVELCAGSDLVLNLGGVNPLRPWLLEAPVRVLVDKDPGFTQARSLADPAHTALFTFGENIENLPDDGLRWRPTRHPVHLPSWPASPPRPDGAFTTVMQWESYPPVEHEGRVLGPKSYSFADVLHVPRRTGARFELAVSGPTPHELLGSNGWTVRDPANVAGDPESYRRYIGHSKAEFAVAKHGYVVTWSGWFSERSACYLASGRPVVTQETGFSNRLPSGAGLLPYATTDEAVDRVEQVELDYERHCRAARELAEVYFDSRRVLTRLVDRAMAEREPAHAL